MNYSDNMKKLSLLFLSVLLLSSCEAANEEVAVIETPETVASVEDVYLGDEYIALLESVDDTEAYGAASASYSEDEYFLSVSFGDLTPLEEGYFYEGWLVRNDGELSVISTGAVENNMNFYTSELDLTDHTQYILTLEPDDGDPAPAGHVLEGSFTQLN